MKRNNDFKQFVTGNLGKKKGKDSPNNGISGHANTSVANAKKVMKRDKGH